MDNGMNIGPDSPEEKKDKDKPDIEELVKSFNEGEKMPQDSEKDLSKMEIPDLNEMDDEKSKTEHEDITLTGDTTGHEPDAGADKADGLKKMDLDSISEDISSLEPGIEGISIDEESPAGEEKIPISDDKSSVEPDAGADKADEVKKMDLDSISEDISSLEPGIEGISIDEESPAGEEKIPISDDKSSVEPDAGADKAADLKKIDLDSISFDLGGESEGEEEKVESAEPGVPEISMGEGEPPAAEIQKIDEDTMLTKEPSLPEEQPASIPGGEETVSEVQEEKKLKKKKSKVPLLVLILIVICAGYYFLFMRKKEELLVVKKPPVRPVKQIAKVETKKIESPYIYSGAKNVQKDISEGITMYVYDTDADMDTLQKFYKQKMILLEYKLKSDKYKTKGDYIHLVFSKDNKDCSVVLRRQNNKVSAVVSYVE